MAKMATATSEDGADGGGGKESEASEDPSAGQDGPNPPTTRHKVIIIGAGMAGIAAANYLATKGETDFVILEARNRVGGRIVSIPLGGVNIELGTQWIHGVMGNPLYELALANGLVQLDCDPRPHAVVATTEDGKRVPVNVVEEVYGAYFWFFKRCEEYFLLRFQPPAEVANSVGRHLRLDVDAYLAQFQGDERRVRAMIFRHLVDRETCITGCHCMDEAGLSDFGSYTELPGGNIVVPRGYMALLECLLRTLPPDRILCRRVVRKIRWNRTLPRRPLPDPGPPGSESGLNIVSELTKEEVEEDPVEVECEGGEVHRGRHVVVTLPLGVLQEQCAQLFDPPLPDYKLDCMRHLCFGVVDKIYLEFDRPFLDPDVAEVITLWDVRDDEEEEDVAKRWFRKIYSFSKVSPNVLVAYVSGKEAEHLETLSEDEVAETCTHILRKFLNDPYVPRPCRVVRTSWKKQPFSRGSYTFIGVDGTQRDIELLASPVYTDPYQSKPVLLFAGEATHPSFYSTAHGAYLSGRRAAELLVDAEDEGGDMAPSWSTSQPRSSVGDLSSWLQGIDLT